VQAARRAARPAQQAWRRTQAPARARSNSAAAAALRTPAARRR
jgi:hypothetical protein